MSHSTSLGIPWKNVMKAVKKNIKSVKPQVAPKHKYTQRQLDTLAQARPILYKSVVAEGYLIVPEPQRVVEVRPVAEFATGLATHNPKVEQKAKKTMTTENTVETPAAPVAKKVAAKKVVKKTTTTVTTPKASKKATTKKAAPAKAKAESKDRISAEELQSQILKFMRKGTEYSSREIVEGLGRTPGANEGGPVVRNLKALVEAGTVAYGSNEEKRGTVWVKQ